MKEKSEENVLEYAERIKEGISNKADSNKTWSTRLFLIVLFATVLSPILILLPVCDWFSKYLPAFLTASAALASGWIQLRKPQERWTLYRTAQREIEFEIDQYNHKIGEYQDERTRNAILSDKVSRRALQLHFEWIPIVPKAEDLQKVLGKTGGGSNAKIQG